MSKWIKKDLKYLWHPYTQMKDCETMPPLLIEKARGLKLYDDNGNIYLDTISSWWCNIHGHNHPKIKAAIKEQVNRLDHVLFAGFTHKPAILLAEQLINIAPTQLTRVFFSDNGSTAVETALKMSFQYWHNTGKKEKKKFISLDYAYHGDTVGTMSVGGVGLFNEMYSSLFFSSYKVPSPYCYRCPVGKERDSCNIECIEPLEKLIMKRKNEVAALILEPLVMAAGGMIIYPKEYLEKAANLAKKNNVHLILDEVATGFGRTRKMFACEHANIHPDFMCLSKGITSGTLPMGATLTTEKIFKAFYDDYEKKKTFYHGHTYTANPIACATALASLNIFNEEDTLNRIQKIIPLIQKNLEKFKILSIVGDVRHIGMISAIELVKNKNKKLPFGFEERIGIEVYKEGLKKGIILRPLGNVVYLFLPLCIKNRELKTIFDICYRVIEKIGKDNT